jgi:CRISPR-associated endonuclease Csn1
MESKKKVHIGVDLGPTSIGLAAIDEDGKPILKPFIFRCADACDEKTGKPTMSSRREYRAQRRNIQREKTLKHDALKLFSSYFSESIDKLKQIIDSNKTPAYLLKYKGLANKLSKNEIIICLYNYLKHRGYFHQKNIEGLDFPSNIL